MNEESEYEEYVSTDWTALHFAVYQGNVDIVKTLLKHPDIDITIQDSRGNTPVHFAVMFDKVEILELLVDHDPSVQAIKNNDGETCLSLLKRLCPDLNIH